MESIKAVGIDSQTRPVALRRSIKIPRKSSFQQTIDSETSPEFSSQDNNNHSTNDRDSQQSTNICIDTKQQSYTQANHIKLVIGNKKDTSRSSNGNNQDLYLATLIDEFQSALNRKDCDSTSCYRFKLLSYRLTQTLFERMNMPKKEAQEAGKSNESTISRLNHSEIANMNAKEETADNDLSDEKDKRIKQLERLLSEQKALRCQDANLVEEKAARIKEWVANKLKELENQNRQLRDQNKKQKETVESLSNKLATMSPISDQRRIHINSNNVRYIDQSSPVGTIDVNKSLKARRPHLKHQNKSLSMSSEDEHHNLILVSTSDNIQRQIVEPGTMSTTNYQNIVEKEAHLRESPVYDSVTVEHGPKNRGLGQEHNTTTGNQDTSAPPPPLHQFDRWELQLYNLADRTLSSILESSDQNANNDSSNHLDSIESHNSLSDAGTSRKSASSSKNDLLSLIKPAFTTIEGDQVVDDSMLYANQDEKSTCTYSIHYSSSNDLSHQPCSQIGKQRKDSVDSTENLDRTDIFETPLRSRIGKDRILRTQSLRKTLNPEKLYDVLTVDLIKRGYLIKPGALKNHNRWFVLRNFHLYSYKSESDEISKSNPNLVLKLDTNCQVQQVNQTSDHSFPFRILTVDKNFQFVAESIQIRDEWLKILSISISMSDMLPNTLTRENATHEGLMNVTRQGLSKRCHAVLVGHIIFFLKSLMDPTPLSYVSVKNARIREITDNYDDEYVQTNHFKGESNLQDCSLAIYPRYSLTSDPIYLTLGGQQETDEWFYYLSNASGLDQSYGTPFEQTIVKLMINNSIRAKKDQSKKINSSVCNDYDMQNSHSIILHSDKPISQPLTSLPNETLKTEAIELFKSLLLFIQVPIEPIAIDYHVSLLQNCLSRFLRYPELRNEFYAQLIKQCTFLRHRCGSPKLSTGSSGNSSIDQRSSLNSLSPASGEYEFVTDMQFLDAITEDRDIKTDTDQSYEAARYNSSIISSIPTQTEILQVMQILAITVSLNLPRGRMRWWLMDYLRKFADHNTNVGKYALYTLKAIDRTVANGTRDNIPSRTEIMSILLRNPYDHSNPHSLPVNFSDGSYLVVEADGSTTVEEFVSNISKSINIRPTSLSDFYLFADDPSGSRDLHILEPHRKILDVVGWWEQSFRKLNSGRYQYTRAIKFVCKKRLILQEEDGETSHERMLIVHQMNQELITQTPQLGEALILELRALMAQLSYGDFDRSMDQNMIKCKLEKLTATHIPKRSSQIEGNSQESYAHYDNLLVKKWQELAGKNTQSCIRVYLNCVRRLKKCES